MKRKTGLALGSVILGVVMIFGSVYIMNQVEQGRGELSEAQSKLDRGNGLFNMNPVTRQIGKGVTGEAQRKIDAYGKEADAYEQLAIWLRIGGIILILSGAATLFLAAKRPH